MKKNSTFVLFISLFSLLLGGIQQNLFGLSDKDVLIKGLNAVVKPVWKSTYNPRQRDQLYMPNNSVAQIKHNDWNGTLFFMRTPELSQSLSDMITFEPLDDLFDAKLYEEGVGEESRSKIIKNVFGALNKMTFQEHRLGLSLSKEIKRGRWVFGFEGWAGMSERNFWLDVAEREIIADNLKEVFPASSGSFDQSKFINIEWGIGDILTRAAYQVEKTDNRELLLGARLIIPTGRQESVRTRYKVVPIDNLYKTGLYVFDRAKEVFLGCSLGNGGHYGLGFYAQLDWQVKNLTLNGFISGDYLAKAHETRFFMYKAELDEDGDIIDSPLKESSVSSPSVPSSDGEILEYTKRRVLPEPATIMVNPGNVINGRITALWKPRLNGPWGITAGYDVFFKTAEKLERFKVASDKDLYANTPQVARKKKLQHKAMLGFVFDQAYNNVNLWVHTFKDFSLSIKGGCDYSFGSSGMGNDWTLSFGMGAEF